MRCISILAPRPLQQSPCNRSFTKIVVPTLTAIYQYNHEARRWDAVLFSLVVDLCPGMRRIHGYLTVLPTTSAPRHSTTPRNKPLLKTTTSQTRPSNRSLVCNRFSTTVLRLSLQLPHQLTLGEARLGCRQTHAMESVTQTEFSLKEIWKSWLQSRASL